MYRWIVLLVAMVFLSGCAARWEHSTKRQSEFYADDRECQHVGRPAAQAVEPGTERVSYESCMWEKGWRKKSTFWFFDPPSRQ